MTAFTVRCIACDHAVIISAADLVLPLEREYLYKQLFDQLQCFLSGEYAFFNICLEVWVQISVRASKPIGKQNKYKERKNSFPMPLEAPVTTAIFIFFSKFNYKTDARKWIHLVRVTTPVPSIGVSTPRNGSTRLAISTVKVRPIGMGGTPFIAAHRAPAP